ncbi:MAG TPA: alpha/beta fold hydrolase [Gemmatimonadaceae bacterium]|nr:alpha/beta fold hydrolase [Gemmatimonadaceae bacterium]
MRLRSLVVSCLGVFVAIARPSVGFAQHTGRLVADTLHPKALEDNKYGDSPNRAVLVYLPPSYDSVATRRYPTLYLLHGFGSNERVWVRGYRGFSVQTSADSLIAAGAMHEMIIVMPNGSNRLGGSFYTNSEATGNWDDFIAQELVAYIDGKYRTIARADARGLAGHSMGGYGAFALAERHGGDVYSAVYALSGCCTRFAHTITPGMAPVWQTLSRLTSPMDARGLQFLPQVFLAMSAAFSPNVNKPPFYVDFPFEEKDGRWKTNEDVERRWIEHSPEEMVRTYRDHLTRLRAFAFDVGDRDELVASGTLDSMDATLNRAGIAHTYETYPGTHTSEIGARMITKVLPFFSRTLAAPTGVQ